MATLLEHECPACGGELQFDAASQKVKCPYCDSEFEIEELKGIEQTQPTEHVWQEGESVHSYVCSSCGGEILCDESTAATSCPYCDSPVVMTQQVSGQLKPDLVIPFKLDKEAAKEALKRHVSGKRLLPKCFKAENRINQIKGIYVPFWLYDADTDANITYHTTKVRNWSDSNYYYTQTRHFRVHRCGTVAFEAVPVDGSSKMANELMESIEPYDLSQAVDFQSAYLAGYLADKYDIPWETTQTRANERIRNSTADAVRQTVVGYTSVTSEHEDIRIHNGRVRYALLPVWMLFTQYKGNDYVFAMNGQTGKMVGNLPVDWTAYWLWFALITAISTAAAYLLALAFF